MSATTPGPDVGQAVTRTLADVPDLSRWVDLIQPGHADPAGIRGDMLDVAREAIAAHPRSHQEELGPSQIGEPCARKLAHKLAGSPQRQPRTPWRPAVGTAVHAEYTAWCHDWNAAHGTRWLTDLLVHVGDLYPGRPVFGHLDVLDLATATVIDWKVPGPSSMRKHKTAAGGPERDQTYRKQAHLYGAGARNAGFPVARVGILRVPAAGELDDAIWTHEPFDASIAGDALERAGGIARMIDTLGPDAVPLFPTTESYCQGCPFYDPTNPDLRVACPGAESVVERRLAPPQYLSDLIA